MNILKAVTAFDRGKHIMRASWDHGGVLGFMPGSNPQFENGFVAGAYMINENNNATLYTFSLDDIRAEDWMIVK